MGWDQASCHTAWCAQEGQHPRKLPANHPKQGAVNGDEENPILLLLQSREARIPLSAIPLYPKHFLNQFHLICEFVLFLYHSKSYKGLLNPQHEQKQFLLLKSMTN